MDDHHTDRSPSSAVIALERPDTADAVALITELEAHLEPLYPRASRHGLSIGQLLAQDVAFFLLRWDGTPASCGGVRLFGDDYAEVKRMYVRPPFRGLGLGKRTLRHLEVYTRSRGIDLLRLETGIHQHEAIGLYERMDFYRIPPFGAYTHDPLSLYFEKRLA
jgi:putative acetyltransferase